MKKSTMSILIIICLWLVFPGANEMSAQQGPGGPGNGGGKGGGSAKSAAGALYGDLYVLERDGNGVPVTRAVTYTDPTTGKQVTVSCVQPISAAGCTPSTVLLPLEQNGNGHSISGVQLASLSDCSLLPLNGEKADFNPELEDACGVQAEYLDCIQEVKFGRESVSRAPASVMDMSYGEALNMMNSAAANQCICDYETNFCSTESKDTRAVKRDPAGRLTLCIPLEDGSGYTWKTIDAPLENLGLYRATMTNGCLGKITEEKVGEEGVRVVATTALDPTGIFYLTSSGLDNLVCEYGATLPATEADAVNQELACQVTSDPVGATADTACWWESPITPSPVTGEDMLFAAVFVASGADKTSPITIDEIINVNTYLGINTWTYTRVKNTRVLNVTYFPFEYPVGTWFTYTRGMDACTADTQAFLLAGSSTTFTAQNISLFADTVNGVNLNSVNITVCRSGSPLVDSTGELVACNDALINPVYSDSENGCGGANWFTQAAEDARKAIWYLHNWSVPEIAY